MKMLKKKGIVFTLIIFVIILALAITARASIYSGIVTETFDFNGMDGTKIHAVIYRPPNAEKKLPAVIVVHGFGESHSTMNAINTELARHGILVMSIDYRGHGDSDGGVNYIGDPLLAPNISNDLFAAYQKLLTRTDIDVSRIGVIGHSMGSRAALVFSAFVPTMATIMIGPYYVWETALVNTTIPRNLLIIVGENDIITPPDLGRELFSKATGYMGREGEVYGDFSNGTARKLCIISGADHYTVLTSEEAIKEILNWLYNSFGISGVPEIVVNPSILATSTFVSYLVLILIFPVIYYTNKTISNKFKPGKEIKLPYGKSLGVIFVIVGIIAYILIAYYSFPMVVDVGWKNYRLFMLSGAQYTIYYFYYLLLPIFISFVVIGAVLLGLKVINLNMIKEKVLGGLMLGIVLSIVTFIWVFIGFNIAFTEFYGDYLLTARRIFALLFLMTILYPLLFIDEIFLRYVIQENVPINKKPLKMLLVIIIEYLIRIVPLMLWFTVALNKPALVDIIYNYYRAGLISDMTIVVAFLPMNAYSLYYSFASIELFHATSATYIYEETKNVPSTTLLRALLLSFTMAAALPFL